MLLIVCTGLLFSAGCTGVIPGQAGNISPGNNQNGGNSAGGSQGGYSPVSKSIDTEGTETWQVTFSGTDTWSASSATAATSDSLASKSESSHMCNLQGSFPVTVHREILSTGVHYDLANGAPTSYPASGSCTESSHGEESGGSGIADSYDKTEQASLSTAEFNFDIHPDGWGVQLSSDSKSTGEEKDYKAAGYTGNNQPYYGVEPISDMMGPDFDCNSVDSFWGGKPEFHRDGSAYVIDCKGTNNVESEGQTGVVTLHMTLDPDYVQGSPTKTKPTPEETLVPLVPSEENTLVPLVPPTTP